MKLIRYDYPTLPSLEDFDRFFDEAFGSFLRGGRLSGLADSQAFTPRADLFEDKENVFVRLELPGVKKEELKIELENRVLTISGERRNGSKEEAESFAFNSSFSVPDGVQSDRIKARLEDGILTVTLPKAEERKPRLIEVR